MIRGYGRTSSRGPPRLRRSGRPSSTATRGSSVTSFSIATASRTAPSSATPTRRRRRPGDLRGPVARARSACRSASGVGERVGGGADGQAPADPAARAHRARGPRGRRGLADARRQAPRAARPRLQGRARRLRAVAREQSADRGRGHHQARRAEGPAGDGARAVSTRCRLAAGRCSPRRSRRARSTRSSATSASICFRATSSRSRS